MIFNINSTRGHTGSLLVIYCIYRALYNVLPNKTWNQNVQMKFSLSHMKSGCPNEINSPKSVTTNINFWHTVVPLL